MACFEKDYSCGARDCLLLAHTHSMYTKHIKHPHSKSSNFEVKVTPHNERIMLLYTWGSVYMELSNGVGFRDHNLSLNRPWPPGGSGCELMAAIDVASLKYTNRELRLIYGRGTDGTHFEL